MSKIAITIFAITALILYTFVSDLLHHSHLKTATDTSRIFTLEQGSFDNILTVDAIPYAFIIFICFVAIVIYLCKWLYYRWIEKQKLNYVFYPFIKNGPTIWFGLALLCLVLMFFGATDKELIEAFVIPMVLLLMMLSIEWLIFMKSEIKDTDSEDDKTKSKQTDNTPLYVLTFVAILLDMGLGSVEWLLDSSVNGNYKILFAKLASAVVLGAICFFSGKFLEMHRAQQKQDRETMDKCVEEIKNGKKP